VPISDALSFKATRRDAIAKLKFWGLRMWAAAKPNGVTFTVAVGCHVNAA